MATFSPSDSRRRYSWWWDSHITPKNSKWLLENLSDMDSKIKLMIKIVDEDAESFAKRAEMFYRRRPELMSLLEELYRGYRALAERYDHAAGALRQAHRTMAEAFPDQVPLELDDDDDLPPNAPPFISPFAGAASTEECQRLQNEVLRLAKENEEMKGEILAQMERGERAELEATELRAAVARVDGEREAAVARLLNLKLEVCHTQEEFKRHKEEMHAGLRSLSSAEERCHLLEKTNQSLLSKLDKLRRKAGEQQEVLNEKQMALEELSISVQEEQLRSMQAEMARLTLEKQLAEAREKMKLMAGERNKLRDVDTRNARLAKELEKIQEEHRKLFDENRASAARIVQLQDEVAALREAAELRDDGGRWRLTVADQMEAMNASVGSLRALAEEVKDGNVELKEIIKNHEDVHAMHVENVRQLQRLSEKNERLELSLLAANTELEVLKETKRGLEDACQRMSSTMSAQQSERAMFVAQVEAISQTTEKLLEKNILLENSLSDANAELESLRRKTHESEEAARTLRGQNAALRTEKKALLSKVESLEASIVEHEQRRSELQKEKEAAIGQANELQGSLELERGQHRNLVEYGKNQIRVMQKQIDELREDCLRRERQLEDEESLVAAAQSELFVLKSCLADAKEANASLSAELQKRHDETGRREEEINTVMLQNEKLADGIRQVVQALNLEQKYESLDRVKTDVVVQLVVHEIRCMANAIADAKDGRQNQMLEKSLVVTLLEHFGREVADLRSERCVLKDQLLQKNDELAVLDAERRDAIAAKKKLQAEVDTGGRKADELKAQSLILARQLSDLQDSRKLLQSEIISLIEENSALANKLHLTREKEKALEEECGAVLSKAVDADVRSLVLAGSLEEQTSELAALQRDFGYLRAAGNELYQEIKLMNKTLVGAVDVDRSSSGSSEHGKRPPVRRDTELLKGGGGRRSKHDNHDADEDAVSLHRANEMLRLEFHRLRAEVEALISKEKAPAEGSETAAALATQPHRDSGAIKSCDAEVTRLLKNIQLAVVNAALFKEKVMELIVACESFEISSMVQREVLKGEISRRNSFVDELKDRLNAVEVENRRLKVDLDGDSTLLGMLRTEVDSLEKQTMALAKDCLPPPIQKKRGDQVKVEQSTVGKDANQSVTTMVKNVEVQRLNNTIGTLKKVVADIGVLLEPEKVGLNSNIATGSSNNMRKQADQVMKQKEILHDGITMETSYKHILKDIQLDLVQASSENSATGPLASSSFHRREMGKAVTGSDDHVSATWSTTRATGTGKHGADRALEHPQRPSSDMIEKELGIDRQEELPAESSSSTSELKHQEWNRVFDRFAIHGQRLSALQSVIQQLKANVEEAEQPGQPASPDLDNIKAQIQDAEDNIGQLIDANSKLAKKAEDLAASPEGQHSGKGQRKMTDRARKVTDKIDRIEIELQKIQQSLMKHKQEMASRRSSKALQRRSSRVLLIDYLYGRRRDSRKQRGGNGRPCGCMRAKTDDD